MSYKFKVPIGDWSGDGHRQCDIFTVECNYGVEEVRQAYKDSCFKTNIQFNRVGGKDHCYISMPLSAVLHELDEREIATDYEDSRVPYTCSVALLEKGIDLDKYTDVDDLGRYIPGTEEFLCLLFEFIKITLPDLEWKFCDDELEYLNGFWNKDLNVQFGYGLYN